ncbi:hypothetical protein [Methylibium sp.]|uniref:hypothetical protein n=1 Tax=Methylibium sp. TaxID=2067992 RepID=UPI003BA8D48C
MTTKTPPLITELTTINASTDGKAARLTFATDGGPLVVQLRMDALRSVLVGLLQASVSCEARGNRLAPIAEAELGLGVLLPVSEISVLPVKGAYKRVAMRTGMVDVNLMVKNRAEADGLAQALLA